MISTSENITNEQAAQVEVTAAAVLARILNAAPGEQFACPCVAEQPDPFAMGEQTTTHNIGMTPEWLSANLGCVYDEPRSECRTPEKRRACWVKAAELIAAAEGVS